MATSSSGDPVCLAVAARCITTITPAHLLEGLLQVRRKAQRSTARLRERRPSHGRLRLAPAATENLPDGEGRRESELRTLPGRREGDEGEDGQASSATAPKRSDV